MSAVIWEVGGYLGAWVAETKQVAGTDAIHKVVFEPLPEHVEKLRTRFAGHADVEIRPYGLYDSTGVRMMWPQGDRTSAHVAYGAGVDCEFRDVVAEVDAEEHADIMMQLNVEGDEYAILRRLLTSGRIARIGALQVQFHDVLPGASAARDEIRERLWKTHREHPFMPWIWERWTRRKDPE